MAYAPTLTASTDANPSPRVLVTFSTLAATTQTINVTRVVEGRTYKVRGGVGLFAVGGAAVMDNEAAIGAANSYRAEMFDASMVSLGFTDAAAVTISTSSVFSDTSQVWIHQPLKPSLAIRAYMSVDTAADLQWVNPGGMVYPEGAAVGTRIGGQRQGLTGMTVSIVCANGTDADEFLSMFGGYSADFPAVLCIRTAPPVRVPRILFASVDALHEVTDYLATPFIRMQMSIDEVQPPSPGLLIPSLRREDIDFAFATRTLRAAAYATRIARDTDYTKAGLAGP